MKISNCFVNFIFFFRRVHSKMEQLFMAQAHPDTKNTLQTKFYIILQFT